MTVGFFGKVRSHGDFVSRRLPPGFQVPFDAWIQAWLVQGRADLGADWLPTWLSSPLWRFLLAPGVCGPDAWTGVMMPSADRVGRCFPLILAASLRHAPALSDCRLLHAQWYDELEGLALSTLDGTFVVEQFDALLQVVNGMPQPAPDADAAPVPVQAVVTTSCGSLLAQASPAGGSAWWGDGSAVVAPCVAVYAGLPATTFAVAFIDGKWQERGWTCSRGP